jgi:hypothetical protein
MRTVIAGAAKSGTTALFYRLKANYPEEPHCYFEPSRSLPWQRATHQLTKIIVRENVDFQSFEDFDKKVLIVRDVRDVIVSGILYYLGYHRMPDLDEPHRAQALSRLREKEAAPGEYSIVELAASTSNRSVEEQIAVWQADAARLQDFAERYRDYFVFHYEQFVQDQVQGLESCLGISLQAEGPVTGLHARVTRTRAYGNWRIWFNPADVDYLRPLFSEPLAHWGYDSADWEITPVSSLDAATGSLYVEKLCAQASSKRFRKLRQAVHKLVVRKL